MSDDHDLAIGTTFYTWLFSSLALGVAFLIWAYSSYHPITSTHGVPVMAVAWTEYTTVAGIVIVVFVAYAVAFFAAMIHASVVGPSNPHFFDIPVSIQNGEDSLMADELIRRHDDAEKKKKRMRKLRKALEE